MAGKLDVHDMLLVALAAGLVVDNGGKLRGLVLEQHKLAGLQPLCITRLDHTAGFQLGEGGKMRRRQVVTAAEHR
ncbi:hypothetical protein D3C78_1419590 [compost metagenome]